MNSKLLYLFVLVNVMSCQREKPQVEPLVAVIKLQSAEALGDMKEAKKYLDVDRAYSRFVNDTTTAEKAWSDYVSFARRISNDQKFTNAFNYGNYDISQNIEGKNAKVVFRSNDETAQIKEIGYVLEMNETWKVVDIAYEKRQ